MTSITISLVVNESIIIILLSYIVDFLLICIITLCYLTLYADPQLKIAIFWSSKTIVLCGALRVKKVCLWMGILRLQLPNWKTVWHNTLPEEYPVLTDSEIVFSHEQSDLSSHYSIRRFACLYVCLLTSGEFKIEFLVHFYIFFNFQMPITPKIS